MQGEVIGLLGDNADRGKRAVLAGEVYKSRTYCNFPRMINRIRHRWSLKREEMKGIAVREILP